jgi:hypothetical protein
MSVADSSAPVESCIWRRCRRSRSNFHLLGIVREAGCAPASQTDLNCRIGIVVVQLPPPVTMLCDAEYGGLSDRWQFAVATYGSSRIFFAFVLDLVLYRYQMDNF